MKNVLAISLAAVVIFSAGAAEANSVTNGFLQTTTNNQVGMFFGDNFAVNMSVAGGVFFLSDFNTGTLNAGVGLGTIFNSPVSTITIGSNSCTPVSANCGALLTFTFAPNLLPAGTTTADAPFTMSGMLRVGNVTLDIDGSGTLQAINLDSPPASDFVRFNFAVAESSTAAFILSGLVAVVGWSRLRGGRRAG